MITTCFKSVGWSLLVLGSYRSASRTHQLQVSRCVHLQPTMGRKLEEFLEFRLPMRLLLTVGHATYCYLFVFLLKRSGRAGHLYIHVILLSICVLTVSICLCFTLAYHGGVFHLSRFFLFFTTGPFGGLQRVPKKTSNKNHQREKNCAVWVSWHHCAKKKWCVSPKQREPTSVLAGVTLTPWQHPRLPFRQVSPGPAEAASAAKEAALLSCCRAVWTCENSEIIQLHGNVFAISRGMYVRLRWTMKNDCQTFVSSIF